MKITYTAGKFGGVNWAVTADNGNLIATGAASSQLYAEIEALDAAQRGEYSELAQIDYSVPCPGTCPSICWACPNQ